MIPSVLQDAAEALKTALPNEGLPDDSGDSRMNSAIAERLITDALSVQDRWSIENPNIDSNNNRHWYDIKIDGLFCDIKVTTTKTKDNMNAKHAIYYLLTGLDPHSSGVPSRNDAFFKSMSDNENCDDSRDFYYIVVNKQDLEDVFIVSLKGATVVPAHNNPPIQCRWDDCRVPIERSWNEAKNYLLTEWAKCVTKGITTLQNAMPVYYPEFFDEH